MLTYAQIKDLTSVCKDCRFRESDSKDEYSPVFHYCERGLILPTKSNTCKLKNDKSKKAWWQKSKGGE